MVLHLQFDNVFLKSAFWKYVIVIFKQPYANLLMKLLHPKNIQECTITPLAWEK